MLSVGDGVLSRCSVEESDVLLLLVLVLLPSRANNRWLGSLNSWSSILQSNRFTLLLQFGLIDVKNYLHSCQHHLNNICGLQNMARRTDRVHAEMFNKIHSIYKNLIQIDNSWRLLHTIITNFKKSNIYPYTLRWLPKSQPTSPALWYYGQQFS